MKHNVYSYFRNNYDISAYIWLSLGLRPDINRHNKLMANIGKQPNEIIKHILSFMGERKKIRKPVDEGISIPLKFWFCSDNKLSLPMVWMPYREIKIKINIHQ